MNDASETGEQRRVYIRTFGCQMNEYDSQKLLKLLEPKYLPVAEAEEADLIVINTCSVREKPERKLFSLLGELGSLKRVRPKLRIGVGGCIAQQEGQRLIDRAPVVDFVFGTHNLSLVPALIARHEDSGLPQVAVDYREEWEDLPLAMPGQGAISVFTAISRGCDKSCTYCIVPRSRGSQVSREPGEIAREVSLAVRGGAREVMLLGQTVNSYGSDRPHYGTFMSLLAKLEAIEDLKRIRFTSPHPSHFDDALIEHMASSSKICRHVHLPLQSGSDRILTAMDRNYTSAEYLDVVRRLRTAMPDIALTTDIIVGFPGESDADFEDTLRVMRGAGFMNSFSFVFSARPGTKAAVLDDGLSQESKLARLHRLQALQEELSRACLASWVGKDITILIEGRSRGDAECYQGKTSQHTTVNLAPSSASLKEGMFVECRVTEAARFTLRADFIRVVA